MTRAGFDSLVSCAEELGRCLQDKGLVCCTVESCTGGMVSMAITAVPGSSGWFDRSFVTYTDQAKHEMVGVSYDTLAKNGAVSEPVVREMARGALGRSEATLAVSISGIAGPGGSVPGKPVGTVCIGVAAADGREALFTEHFQGDRESVRLQASVFALCSLISMAT